MSSLPTSLKTLPPDGTDLDELIGALQSEYGVPTTPQEYRLIIKVPAAEEHTDPQIEVKPEAVVAERPQADEADVPPARVRPSRRRRRGRRRGGVADVAEVDGEDVELADFGRADDDREESAT
jgi:hypothetical protein